MMRAFSSGPSAMTSTLRSASTITAVTSMWLCKRVRVVAGVKMHRNSYRVSSRRSPIDLIV